jgi:hypothetical protein
MDNAPLLVIRYTTCRTDDDEGWPPVAVRLRCAPTCVDPSVPVRYPHPCWSIAVFALATPYKPHRAWRQRCASGAAAGGQPRLEAKPSPVPEHAHNSPRAAPAAGVRGAHRQATQVFGRALGAGHAPGRAAARLGGGGRRPTTGGRGPEGEQARSRGPGCLQAGGTRARRILVLAAHEGTHQKECAIRPGRRSGLARTRPSLFTLPGWARPRAARH